MITTSAATLLDKKYIDFLTRWEGGTSSKSTDFAARCYSGGIHTVRGITWCTYHGKDGINGLAEKLGLPNTHSYFVGINDREWNNLFNLYVSELNLQRLDELIAKNPFLAFSLIEMGWMSGGGGMEGIVANFQRKYMGIVDDNITRPEIVANFINTTIPYDRLNKQLYWHRKYYYGSLNQPSNYKGWMHRLYDLYDKFASPYVKMYSINQPNEAVHKPK